MADATGGVRRAVSTASSRSERGPDIPCRMADRPPAG